MYDGKTAGDLVHFVGVMAICVGLAWIVQVLGFSDGDAGLGRFAWVLAAAVICGAGVGLVLTSLPRAEAANAAF